MAARDLTSLAPLVKGYSQTLEINELMLLDLQSAVELPAT
jgi:hypothetical protein